jgi:hypothetical protein
MSPKLRGFAPLANYADYPQKLVLLRQEAAVARSAYEDLIVLSVDIGTGHGPNGQGSIPSRGKRFFLFHCV